MPVAVRWHHLSAFLWVLLQRVWSVCHGQKLDPSSLFRTRHGPEPAVAGIIDRPGILMGCQITLGLAWF